VVSRLLLTATVSGQQAIATPYEFELSMHAQGDVGSVVVAFKPLRPDLSLETSSMSFDGAADSYCYTVRARPILGGEPFTLMTTCIANSHTYLGRNGRSPEEVAQGTAACEATSAPVDAGVLTMDQVDAATDADGELLGRGENTPVVHDESGCQLADGGQTGRMAWSTFALLALAFVKRRRAT
jgi:hypothetical protein